MTVGRSSTKGTEGRRGWVRKNMAMDPKKLTLAKRHLGAKTETDAVDAALDLVAFQAEVLRGVETLAKVGAIRDVFAGR